MVRYITDKQMLSIFFVLRDDLKFMKFNKNMYEIKKKLEKPKRANSFM